jgi:hypothetical protein
MRKRAALTLLACSLLSGCGMPAQTNVEVPFTSQAPAGDWSEPWQNACEETSIYMVSSFYANDPIKRDQAVLKIKEILKVKNQDIKVSKDESLATISQLIVDLGLPWTTELVSDPTKDDLKKELAAGRPIIVPVYAPSLKSTHYNVVSPDYHVLVLTGYDDTQGMFIVNDPGTKDGEGLRFPYDTFMSAIHDLDSKNFVAGKKAVLFTKEKGLADWLANLGKTN